MKWVRFGIETRTETEDILVAALYDIGLEGAVIEDNVPLSEEEKAGMFVDIPLMEKEDDGTAFLTFYAELTEDKKAVIQGEEKEISEVITSIETKLNEVRENADIGSGTIMVSETDDEDWRDNWKEFFHQFTIGDLLIIPSWEEPEKEKLEKSSRVLHIDPGTAFGTGAHETTSLVIRQLQKRIKGGEELLDIGTGSGILPIVALLYGSGNTVATEIDENCADAVEQNWHSNAMDEKGKHLFTVYGNIISDTSIQEKVRLSDGYDIITANILAEVLVDLTPIIPGFLKDGGIYITSGIIDEKEPVVIKAVEDAGLKVLEVTRDGEWVCITAAK